MYELREQLSVKEDLLRSKEQYVQQTESRCREVREGGRAGGRE